MEGKPVIIGLLGGIASGKSTVARIFSSLGARVVDADRIAHEVLCLPMVAAEIGRQFGPDVLDAEGRPNRDALAAKVFGDPELLKALESIVHPPIRERVQAEIASTPDGSLVVLDAPLLIERNLDHLADLLIYVETPDSLRAQRASATRGWDPEELRRREGRQAPLAEKRARAHVTVRNTGTVEELDSQVRRILEDLRASMS